MHHTPLLASMLKSTSTAAAEPGVVSTANSLLSSQSMDHCYGRRRCAEPVHVHYALTGAAAGEPCRGVDRILHVLHAR